VLLWLQLLLTLSIGLDLTFAYSSDTFGASAAVAVRIL
jgi:hypothetical protein